MVFNRLCAPDSKLGCLRWLETTAMPAMSETVTHQHLLRAMDALIDHAEVVEAELARQIRPLVDHDLAVVFYDLTTVRIHGEGEVTDDLRAFGMNKETGGIARQFVLGLVQTAEGLPLMHTVHSGNMAETRTLQAMLATVLERFPIQRVILVADRGLLSLENIGELTARAEQGGRKLEFILAVPARRYTELAETFRKLTFSEDGLAEASFAGHRLIVAHDPLRAQDQTARRRARIAEFEAMAEKMVTRLDGQDAGETARGRRASDRGAYGRFTRAVAEAELSRFIKADLNADRFSWGLDEAAISAAELFDGKPALITNAPDLTPAEAVAHYKALSDIERGFRVLKSDIEIAPVHHRLPGRIRAHALICFLALVLYRVMRMRLKAKGHGASPRTALELLARIQRHQAKIGERSLDGISTTTPEQLELFNSLNLPKPA
jgi:transposase